MNSEDPIQDKKVENVTPFGSFNAIISIEFEFTQNRRHWGLVSGHSNATPLDPVVSGGAFFFQNVPPSLSPSPVDLFTSICLTKHTRRFSPLLTRLKFYANRLLSIGHFWRSGNGHPRRAGSAIHQKFRRIVCVFNNSDVLTLRL